MKRIRNLLVFLAIGAIVCVSVINIKLGAASYGKISSSLTLKALASGEAGGGCEIGQYCYGKWVSGTTTHVRYWKDLSNGKCYDEQKETRTFECASNIPNPAYAKCGTIEHIVREVPVNCSTAGF
jgi:hypothetical protein